MILANTPAQAETLLHSRERASADIGLHVNAHKTEYMCFNQTGDISTLNGSSLKLVDKFTYLGSSASSTEVDIDTRLAWTAIDRLSVIWKSDLADKIKRNFFAKQRSCWYWCMDALHGHKLNVWRKSMTAITQECCKQYWQNREGSTPQSSSCTATYHPSRKLSKLDEPDLKDTARKVGTSS